MILAGYIASLLMGLSLGLVGGGGSILTVPILVYFFAINPLVATSESLFIVGMTALIGALIATIKKEVDLTLAAKFAAPSFLGVYLAKAKILPIIPENVFSTHDFTVTKDLLLMILFATLMIFASTSMIRTKKKYENLFTQKKWYLVSIQGFFVGSLTGLVGAGGGFLIVPALVNLVGLNIRSAVGTSLFIIAANSLFGFSLAIAKSLEPNWNLLFSILIVAAIGLTTGSYFSKHVSEKKLKLGFGYFVLIMGTLILIDQIKKL